MIRMFGILSITPNYWLPSINQSRQILTWNIDTFGGLEISLKLHAANLHSKCVAVTILQFCLNTRGSQIEPSYSGS